MIGLASRAGAVKSGEFSVEKAVKSGRGKLVLVASDASDNTKKMFMDMCRFYKVPIRIFGTKEELGHALGQEYRDVVSMQEPGLAQAVRKLLDEKKGN